MFVAVTLRPMEEMRSRVDIGGVRISRIGFEEAVDQLDEWIDRGQKKRVCVVPVNCVLWATKDDRLRSLYNSADLTLCDGVPLLWAARFLGNPLKGRVTGLDLLPRYIEECHRRGYSMFFLGAAEGVAKTLAEKARAAFPGIRIAGHYSPPFSNKFSDEENDRIAEKINSARPDIVWVSLTAPKQDFWIADQLHRLDTKIAIGVGGAFEVTAGLIPRAPRWMQKAGLEWLFRFSREPRRLFQRYFMEAPRFIPLIIKQRFKQ